MPWRDSVWCCSRGGSATCERAPPVQPLVRGEDDPRLRAAATALDGASRLLQVRHRCLVSHPFTHGIQAANAVVGQQLVHPA
jgi:hypothetical protein